MYKVCTRLALFGAFLSAVSCAFAAEEAALKSKVDALVQPLLQSGIPVGFVVGIVEGGKSCIFGYGKLSRDADKTPEGNSVFEIGSVTKVFTGLLLADMVERKLVALEDPVQKFVPENVRVPQCDGRAITLLDLATHTSGLPRLPGNFALSAAKDPANPYADYSVDQLYEFLSQHSLSRKPGTQFEYSNLGVGLLGHALARGADTSYEKLLLERICAPLGMQDTRITLSEDQRSRLVQGHGPRGRPVANWDIPTLAGAGALRSTVNDMLIFLKANLGLQNCPLSAAI
jgi:CubicO group peptidase (beta-lactamase class C family)